MDSSWGLLAMSGPAQHLHRTLFEVSGTQVNGVTLLSVSIVATLTLLAARLVPRGIEYWFRVRGAGNAGSVHAVAKLVHYSILFVGLGVGLQTMGISLGALFTAGAVFAVGLGFALKTMAENFVSGVILLAERAIKPGDVLRIDGDLVRVSQLGIRSTVVVTRDGLNVIMPNSTIVGANVTNYTLHDPVYRVTVRVGVSYSSDLPTVHRVLSQAAHDQAERWETVGSHPTQVTVLDFASSSIEFEVGVWHMEPWESRVAASDLRDAVWAALRQDRIVIAFPQLDVHFHSTDGTMTDPGPRSGGAPEPSRSL